VNTRPSPACLPSIFAAGLVLPNGTEADELAIIPDKQRATCAAITREHGIKPVR
jgi:hypothetical protein